MLFMNANNLKYTAMYYLLKFYFGNTDQPRANVDFKG